MPSKQVISRERSARAVYAAADTHATAVAENFHQLFAPFVEPGDTMPDPSVLAVLMRTVGRAVDGRRRELATADAAHAAELADDAAPRQVRDVRSDELRMIMVETRSQVSTGYGKAGLQALAMTAPIPRGHQALVTYARVVEGNLVDPAVELPQPRRASLAMDRALVGQELGDALSALEAALADVAREEREAEATLRAKHQAMDEHDRMFSRAAAWLSASFAAAGYDDLAARVRPSGRRPGHTADQEDGEKSTEPGPTGDCMDEGPEPPAAA